jgi:hypothetical protein
LNFLLINPASCKNLNQNRAYKTCPVVCSFPPKYISTGNHFSNLFLPSLESIFSYVPSEFFNIYAKKYQELAAEPGIVFVSLIYFLFLITTFFQSSALSKGLE